MTTSAMKYFKRFYIYIILVTCSQQIIATTKMTNIYPAKLQPGDTVGLISSASRAPLDLTIVFAKERIEKLGLHVILGKYIYKRDGYLAGNDQQRASDFNAMIANPKVKAIFEIRGGWGTDRILPLINYTMIKKHPKIIIGFSDITALLIAIHMKTGLVTFHGTLGIEPWPQFTVDYMKKVLFQGEKVTFKNPTNELNPAVDLIQTAHRIQTIYPGQANGELIGGNLTVLTTLLGTSYEPNWQGKILFIEDVGESYYQIDRMLSALQLNGVFNKVNGVIFGQCIKCNIEKNAYGTITLKHLLKHYLAHRHLPSFMGSMFGHDPKMFTLPEGVNVKMNADNGNITLLHAAVSY